MILLDYEMPVRDGRGFVGRYRATAGSHAPIILMTAAHATAWCRELGTDGCLAKPFDVDELLEVVEAPRHQHAA